MLHIVVPMAGKSQFFDESFRFPKPLIEIGGKPMIERVLSSLQQIEQEKRFIFIINQDDASRYYLDEVLRLLAGSSSVVVKQQGEAQGAVCSALLALDHFNSTEPLLIVNADSIIEHDLNTILEHFESQRADAGTVCFTAVHPQWSYVLTDEDNVVIEAAEKRPISTNANAGFYYFREGKDFVQAAYSLIMKESTVQGRYFTSMTFNELILAGKRVVMFKIPNEQYHSFYSPEKVELFQRRIAINS